MRSDPRFKFGVMLLVILAMLALVIGIGHVEEKTSFGLQIILGSISTLAGSWSQWAFGKDKSDGPDTK